MGPPGGPQDAWKVYNGTLYVNFFPKVRTRFFDNADANIAAAEKRWADWWGGPKAGPFNTDCLAETWSEHNCGKDPQVIPPSS